ncbi:MAG: erythromycin esterase family protein [Chitinophagaceae bacterium]|nr:erythromycin esterase family protein [Chitinophagaceae bacterium]
MKRYFTEAPAVPEKEAAGIIRRKALPWHGRECMDALLERIGHARIVMLGEASHGTHEYYAWRTAITKALIEKKGFRFIAVEGDWPDAYRLNRYVKQYEDAGTSTLEVLRAFNRWPTWMWANWEIVSLAEWLKAFNKNRPVEQKAGFYGLDVYSLWESLSSISDYLRKVDPAAAHLAQEAWQCFEPFRQDEGRGYAHATHLAPEGCTDEVVDLLSGLRQRMASYNTDYENVFNAEQNALVAVNAERYYRAMVRGGPHSWNIRDRHMADTLERLLDFHGHDAKAIVWAHNTHIGDARATDMAGEGMYNIGELARVENHENEVALVGFGSYEGAVVAGRNWGAPMQVMPVPPAVKGSWEYLNRMAGAHNRLLLAEDLMDDIFLEHPIGHRAIGVIYHPTREQYGNYVPSVIPLRYDAFIYLDETRALHPLHLEPDGHQVPETYPFGV